MMPWWYWAAVIVGALAGAIFGWTLDARREAAVRRAWEAAGLTRGSRAFGHALNGLSFALAGWFLAHSVCSIWL